MAQEHVPRGTLRDSQAGQSCDGGMDVLTLPPPPEAQGQPTCQHDALEEAQAQEERVLCVLIGGEVAMLVLQDDVSIQPSPAASAAVGDHQGVGACLLQ